MPSLESEGAQVLTSGGPDKELHRETAFEKRLARRFQAGDADALNTLFELHVDRVFIFARTLLNNRADAEEVTSEAFVRAFERASTFRGECPFRGWLFGITRNLALDRLRQPRLLLLDPEQTEWSVSDEGKSAAQMESRIIVRDAVAALSPEYRTALILCDVRQWDAREVAEMLGKSLPAMKSILYRARRALRDLLTEHAEEEEHQ